MSDEAAQAVALSCLFLAGAFAIVSVFFCMTLENCARIWAEAVKAKYQTREKDRGGL